MKKTWLETKLSSAAPLSCAVWQAALKRVTFSTNKSGLISSLYPFSQAIVSHMFFWEQLVVSTTGNMTWLEVVESILQSWFYILQCDPSTLDNKAIFETRKRNTIGMRCWQQRWKESIEYCRYYWLSKATKDPIFLSRNDTIIVRQNADIQHRLHTHGTYLTMCWK